jgi:hypothetical protein
LIFSDRRLKKKIDITNIREIKTAETQTEFLDLTVNFEHFQPLKIEKQLLSSNFLNEHSDYNSRLKSVNVDIIDTDLTSGRLSNPISNFSSTNFRCWLGDTYSEPQQSFPPKETDIDIIDEVDSFLARCNHETKVKEKENSLDLNLIALIKNKYREKDKEVIAKCFPSEQLVEKLIEIYDKQGSLAPDEEILSETEVCDTDRLHSSKSKISPQQKIEEILESNETGKSEIFPQQKIEEMLESNEIGNGSTEKFDTYVTHILKHKSTHCTFGSFVIAHC